MGQKIIAWVRLNMVVVISGGLSLLGLTGLVLGMILPDVQTQFDQDKSIYASLEQAANSPANKECVDAVRERERKLRADVQKFLSESAKTAPRALLKWRTGDASMVFPQLRPDEPTAQTDFLEAAAAKRRELLTILRAKDKPSQDDVHDYRDAMDKARQRERMERGEAPAAGMMGMIPGAMGQPAQPVAPGGGVGGGYGYGGASVNATSIPENMTPEEFVKTNEVAGASVKRAQDIYCYANVEALDLRHQVPPGTEFPSADLLWLSQTSLWIQEDIIQALARVNKEAADQLKNEDDRWVANLPVKHLLYISIGDFLPKTGVADARSMAASGSSAVIDPSQPEPPAGANGSVFTKQPASETLDVTRLAVGLVIDSNYLLKILDELSKAGFYTPLLVNFEIAEPSPTFQEYVYGSAPIIRVRIELEHYIMRDKIMIGDKKLVDLMPAGIKTGQFGEPSRGGAGPSPHMPSGGPSRSPSPAPPRSRIRRSAS